MDPIDDVLSMFPLSLVVYLSRFRQVTLEFFFNLIFPGIQWSEEYSLSPFSDFLSTCNEPQDGFQVSVKLGIASN